MTPMRIILTAATIAALGAAIAPKAHAQGSAATAAAPANPKLAGAWEGNYTTDGPSGIMTLTVTKGPSAWKVANSLSGDAPAPGEPKDVTADGDKIIWTQVFGEYDVKFTGTLSSDGVKVTGTLEASQGGAVVAGGSFTLSRKP